MLNDEQRFLLEEGILSVLQEFEQSGAAFTPSMLISRLGEDRSLADDRLLDQDDAKRFVADVVNRRVDELQGQPRQLVLLEAEAEPRWGFKDAS